MESLCTAIFIPTFNRPHKIKPIIENLHDRTASAFTLYFIVENCDFETIRMIEQAGARFVINQGPPTYTSCINMAYDATSEPFFFLGADDLRFTDNWLKAALACMIETGVGVVGTHDPIHPFSDHAAHYLVSRRYIDQYGGCMDMPNTVLYPYAHSWTDWEFIGTAKARNMYAYCKTSIVEHVHPGWNDDGSVRDGNALFDETYAKGKRHHRQDTQIFVNRSDQWLPLIHNKSEADKYIEHFIHVERSMMLRSLRRFKQAVKKHLKYNTIQQQGTRIVK